MANQRLTASLIKTWDIVSPFIFYYLIRDLSQIILSLLINFSMELAGGEYAAFLRSHSTAVGRVLTGISMLAAVSLLLPLAGRELNYIRLSKQNASAPQTASEKPRPHHPGDIFLFFLLCLLSLSSAAGLNSLFHLTGMLRSSSVYSEVAASQYGVGFGMGLVLYGLLSPLAEETVFRGLIYNRTKKYFSARTSILLSAFLFGVSHGNLVQGVYGFLMGLLIAVSYEICGSLLAPCLFHALANVFVYTVSLGRLPSEALFTPVGCAACLGIAGAALGMMLWRGKISDREKE